MRLVKSSRTLLPLAFSAILASCAFAQERLDVQPNPAGGQLKNISIGSQPPGAAQTSAPPAAKNPAPAAAKAPANAPMKTPAQAPMKAPAKAPAKAPMGAQAKPSSDGKPPAEKPAEEKA